MMQCKVSQGSCDVWISNLSTELMQYCSCNAAVHYYMLLIFSSLIVIYRTFHSWHFLELVHVETWCVNFLFTEILNELDLYLNIKAWCKGWEWWSVHTTTETSTTFLQKETRCKNPCPHIKLLKNHCSYKVIMVCMGEDYCFLVWSCKLHYSPVPVVFSILHEFLFCNLISQ